MDAFYARYPGAVLSTSINKYMYISSHRFFFTGQVRVKYSETETVNHIDELKHPLLRETMRKTGVTSGIEISSIADIPSGTGMGSSSSFTVGLLHCLYAVKREFVSHDQLAREACEIEIDLLGEPIGKQDQYAAAFGGLNHLIFRKSGRVEIDHLVLPDNLLDKVFENSLLIWTGIQRDASDVLSKQNKNVQRQLGGYKSLANDSRDCKEIFLHPPEYFLQEFGKLLEKSWQTKKSLEESISSTEIDEIHSQIKSLGGYGGKLSGAGGGGFFFEIVPQERHEAVLSLYGPSKVLSVAHEPLGSRLLSEIF